MNKLSIKELSKLNKEEAINILNNYSNNDNIDICKKLKKSLSKKTNNYKSLEAYIEVLNNDDLTDKEKNYINTNIKLIIDEININKPFIFKYLFNTITNIF